MRLMMKQCLVDAIDEGKIIEYERCKRIIYEAIRESDCQIEKDCLKRIIERVILEKD